MHRLLLLLVLLLLWSDSAHAESMVGESLEWIVADSDLIVRGKIAKVKAFQDEQQTPWEEATVQVNESIKGTPAKPLKFLVRCVGLTEQPSKWQQEGVELLLFLAQSIRYESLDSDSRKTDFALRLWGADSSFIRLNNKPQTGLFTMDFNVIKERDDILKAVRIAAAYGPDNRPPEHRVEVPFESEVYQTSYSGSGVQLVVPANERLETRAQQWLKSENPGARQQSALTLQFFKSPANIEPLKPLLSDPAYMTTTRGEVSTRVYYVREAAFKTLSDWSVDVEKPFIEVPVDAGETNNAP